MASVRHAAALHKIITVSCAKNFAARIFNGFQKFEKGRIDHPDRRRRQMREMWVRLAIFNQ